MSPIEILAAFEAALATAEGLKRMVESAKNDGDLTQEQIDGVIARAQASDERFDALVARLGT